MQVRVARRICTALLSEVEDDQTESCLDVAMGAKGRAPTLPQVAELGAKGRAPTLPQVAELEGVVGVDTDACEAVKEALGRGVDRPDVTEPFRCQWNADAKEWERFAYREQQTASAAAKEDAEAASKADGTSAQAEEAEEELGKKGTPCMVGRHHGTGAKGWFKRLLNVFQDVDTCSVVFSNEVTDEFSVCPVFTSQNPSRNGRRVYVERMLVVATATGDGSAAEVEVKQELVGGVAVKRRVVGVVA